EKLEVAGDETIFAAHAPARSSRLARGRLDVSAGNELRSCPAAHRHARLAQRNDDDPGQPAARATSPVPRQDRAERHAIDALLAAAHRAAQGRPEHPAHHDRRHRLRRLQHLRRRDPDAEPRPYRRQWPALYQLQLDSAVLADARRTDYGTKP